MNSSLEVEHVLMKMSKHLCYKSQHERSLHCFFHQNGSKGQIARGHDQLLNMTASHGRDLGTS